MIDFSKMSTEELHDSMTHYRAEREEARRKNREHRLAARREAKIAHEHGRRAATLTDLLGAYAAESRRRRAPLTPRGRPDADELDE